MEPGTERSAPFTPTFVVGSGWDILLTLAPLSVIIGIVQPIRASVNMAIAATVLVAATQLWYYRLSFEAHVLVKSYPMRLIGPRLLTVDGVDIREMVIRRSWVQKVGTTLTIHYSNGSRRKRMAIEANGFETKCYVIAFAVRNNIAIRALDERSGRLVKWIRDGTCYIDPMTGYWNIPGVN